MGMTRAVGFGFLLLLVVSLDAAAPGLNRVSEAQKKQAILNLLTSNQFYLYDDIRRASLDETYVGDKIYIVLDDKLTVANNMITRSEWTIDTSASSSHIRFGPVTKIFTSADDSVPSLFRVEVVPMKTGSHTFRLTRTDGNEKIIRMSISQGSVVFFNPTRVVGDSTMESIEILPNTELTVYAEYWSNEYDWEIVNSLNVRTTPIIDASEFEDSPGGKPLKTFTVTITSSTETPYLQAALKKKSDNSVQFSYTLNILQRSIKK